MVDECEESDSDLVARSREGDLQAFDALVTRHRQRVYAVVLGIVRHEEDAYDVAQEVFIRCWKALPRYKPEAAFTTWLLRIATNAAIDFLRRTQRHPERLDIETLDRAGFLKLENQRHPAENMEADDLGQRIAHAMDSLSPAHRAVVLLREVEGLSYEEIAAAVGCSLGTVMSRLFHARKILRKKLHDVHQAHR